MVKSSCAEMTSWLHCCTFLLSPHPADPTLTTENLMEVVKGLERRWKDLADKLRVRYKKRAEIKTTYHNDVHRIEAVVDDYVRYKPDRSWGDVARALQEMGLPQKADAITAKCVRGIS